MSISILSRADSVYCSLMLYQVINYIWNLKLTSFFSFFWDNKSDLVLIGVLHFFITNFLQTDMIVYMTLIMLTTKIWTATWQFTVKRSAILFLVFNLFRKFLNLFINPCSGILQKLLTALRIIPVSPFYVA